MWARVLALTLSCVTSAEFWDLSGPRSPRSEHECDLASTLQPGMSYYLHSVQKEACAKKGFPQCLHTNVNRNKVSASQVEMVTLTPWSFRRVNCFEET